MGLLVAFLVVCLAELVVAALAKQASDDMLQRVALLGRHVTIFVERTDGRLAVTRWRALACRSSA